uniref:Uncharacterized protein LOC116943883 n=1 Tax=Petromyzon marinus TaxID=7757 RepID=A0AAJ7WWZ9_PETMA|nr:uncharacterized protein LOC116943883 [Petromyzon marinus]
MLAGFLLLHCLHFAFVAPYPESAHGSPLENQALQYLTEDDALLIRKLQSRMNTALEGAMVEEVEDCGVAAADEVQGSRENRAALRSGVGQGRSSKTLFQPQRFGRGVPPPAADCPESAAASWAGLQDGNADRASRSEPFWHRTRPQRFGKRGGDPASPM